MMYTHSVFSFNNICCFSQTCYIVLFIKLSLNFSFPDNSSLFYKEILKILRELRREIVRNMYKKYFDNYWR